MKKLIILLVIVTVFTSMPIIAKDNESAEDFIFKINEKMDDFSNWNNLSDFKKYTLYDNKLNVSGYLFSHKNDKGYFILNVDDELIEFSSGQSPYDDYGNHTVTLAGYNDSVVDELLIIHDTWSSTATKVYIAHDTSVKYLHRIYD